MSANETDLQRALSLLHSRPELAGDVLVMAGERQLTTELSSGQAEVKQILRKTLGGLEQEHFMVFAVDPFGAVIDHEILFKGFETMVMTSPKVIWRWALTRNRPIDKLYVAHNHPSGRSTPSEPDIQMTDQLLQGSLLLGLNLADHFIIGSGGDISSLRKVVNENMRLYGTSTGKSQFDFGRTGQDEIIRKILGKR